MAIVREEEAKEKWCPFVRFVVMGDILVSTRGDLVCRVNDYDYASANSCIGKRCTAWVVSSEKSGSCGLVR